MDLHRTSQLISGCSIGLDYCEVEWFALEMNQELSAVFEKVLYFSLFCSL